LHHWNIHSLRPNLGELEYPILSNKENLFFLREAGMAPIFHFPAAPLFKYLFPLVGRWNITLKKIWKKGSFERKLLYVSVFCKCYLEFTKYTGMNHKSYKILEDPWLEHALSRKWLSPPNREGFPIIKKFVILDFYLNQSIEHQLFLFYVFFRRNEKFRLRNFFLKMT